MSEEEIGAISVLDIYIVPWPMRLKSYDADSSTNASQCRWKYLSSSTSEEWQKGGVIAQNLNVPRQRYCSQPSHTSGVVFFVTGLKHFRNQGFSGVRKTLMRLS